MNRIEPSPEAWAGPVAGTREYAMLAHDILGALQGVVGGIDQIGSGELAPEARLQVERVAAAARTLAELVGTAVGTAAGDAFDDCGAEGRAAVDLPRFLHFLEHRWSGEAHARGLAFRLEARPGLPGRIRAGFLALARILGNLIGNSIKFSDRGVVRLAVCVGANGELEFKLQDDGPGLVEATPGKLLVFGRRQHGSEKTGHGLGLQIVKTLCDDLGATVALANRPEGGVEAVVRLPASLCEPGWRAAAERAMPNLSGLCVLLAEDNPTNQVVAGQMLRSLNAEVIIAEDGVEALESFERHRVDLVIVDIEMPRKSGLEVIRTIRARPDRRARVPIVALTAYAMREHRDRIADAGADGLISKPIVSVDAFAHALGSHLGIHLATDGAAGKAEPIRGDAPASEGPVVDLQVYEALCSTIGREMMSELLDKVVSDLAASERVLARALEPLDPAAIRASSHILVSVAGAIGANRLQHCARRLYAAAHGDVQPGLASEVRVCLVEIAAAVEFVREQRALS